MATTIKGQLACPECGSLQDVKDDTKKYFISCSACGTMTHYQGKAAKERIKKKLFPETTDDHVTEAPETEAKEETKPLPTPVRVPNEETSPGLWNAIGTIFD